MTDINVSVEGTENKETSNVKVCSNCHGGIAVTTGGLCEVCDRQLFQ